MNGIYIVLPGDNLSKIADKYYDVTPDEIKSLNKLKSDLILPNQQLLVPLKLLSSNRLSYEDIYNLEDEINKKSNFEIINWYHGNLGDGSYYIIDDKQNNRLGLYKDGNLIKSWVAIHGKNKELDDYTVTFEENNGNVENLKGNCSTPGGIFFAKSDVNGLLRYDKDMIENGNTKGLPSSIHARNIITGKENTNGCTGMRERDLKELKRYLADQEYIPTYILPSQKTNRFVLCNGKLEYRHAAYNKTNNPDAYRTAMSFYRQYEETNTKYNRRIKQAYSYDEKRDRINAQKSTRYTDADNDNFYVKHNGHLDKNAKNVIQDFILGIKNYKSVVLKNFNVTSKQYDILSQYALGILLNETDAGQTFFLPNNILRTIGNRFSDSIRPDYLFKSKITAFSELTKQGLYFILNKANITNKEYLRSAHSRGVTLIRWSKNTLGDSVIKVLQDNNITENDLVYDVKKAAFATMLKLCYEFLNSGTYEKAVGSWNPKIHESYFKKVKEKSLEFILSKDYKLLPFSFNKKPKKTTILK